MSFEVDDSFQVTVIDASSFLQTQILVTPGLNFKTVWVRVSGLPLRAWFQESLHAVGNFLGKVVEMDPSTSSGNHFLFARFRVIWSPSLLNLKTIPMKMKKISLGLLPAMLVVCLAFPTDHHQSSESLLHCSQLLSSVRSTPLFHLFQFLLCSGDAPSCSP